MRILIVRPGAIGDTLVTFPLLHYLRTRVQGTHLTFVGNAAALPLIQAFELADEVASYEERRWSQLFIPPTTSDQYGLQAFLRIFGRAICWLKDADGVITSNLEAAGIPHYSVVPGRPSDIYDLSIGTYLAHSIGEEAALEHQWLVPTTYAWQSRNDHTEGAIAVHPGSGGQAKCWPVAYFARIIKKLWQQHIPVLVLAGPAEQSRLRELLHLLPDPPTPSLYQQLNDAPLLTVAHRLQQCRAYLGNDSGITHLAAMLGLPTVALFGPSNPRVWRPQGPRVTVLHSPPLDHLPPDAVLTVLTRITL
ncbi:glycosyltransferase family 9 protein [Dictyobacter aurantiacus]|uniref:Glycosyl transferase n=1 Tax=Dictyobacter aurantiacus TaxID=1936993 RepID=A0A401ZC62_9CHLR|nr:glycosyltransferase family 9 protein [Dictyobacter aurantiacus]GCE04445.1 glycosyl transferase [Dictyobacter aurantiacus]